MEPVVQQNEAYNQTVRRVLFGCTVGMFLAIGCFLIQVSLGFYFDSGCKQCTLSMLCGSGVVDHNGIRRSDLVFLQNGMITPWLHAVGLQDNTQALIYFGGMTVLFPYSLVESFVLSFP